MAMFNKLSDYWHSYASFSGHMMEAPPRPCSNRIGVTTLQPEGLNVHWAASLKPCNELHPWVSEKSVFFSFSCRVKSDIQLHTACWGLARSISSIWSQQLFMWQAELTPPYVLCDEEHILRSHCTLKQLLTVCLINMATFQCHRCLCNPITWQVRFASNLPSHSSVTAFYTFKKEPDTVSVTKSP